MSLAMLIEDILMWPVLFGLAVVFSGILPVMSGCVRTNERGERDWSVG